MNRAIHIMYYGFLDKNWHKNISKLSDEDIYIYFYNLIDEEVVLPEIKLTSGEWKCE